jgi:hypothetical protein
MDMEGKKSPDTTVAIPGVNPNETILPGGVISPEIRPDQNETSPVGTETVIETSDQDADEQELDKLFTGSTKPVASGPSPTSSSPNTITDRESGGSIEPGILSKGSLTDKELYDLQDRVAMPENIDTPPGE